jgi:rhodanese-related sulfurtransferase
MYVCRLTCWRIPKSSTERDRYLVTKFFKNPRLIPSEKYSVVYCTSLGDETSLTILRRCLAMGFLHVRILEGGLAAWKAEGYPVIRYQGEFHLDTAK